jgi:hypothetical protein
VCAAALGAPEAENEGVAVAVEEELEFHQLRLVASRIFVECDERVKVTRTDGDDDAALVRCVPEDVARSVRVGP